MTNKDINKRKHKFTLSATQYVFISFVAVILVGSLLLYLPISQANPETKTTFIDALFTATSATCVTGQVVVTTATHWSLFGQIVIISLIQIGGLTFISLYAFIIIYLGKKVTLKNRLLIQSAFNQSTIQGMVKLVLMVIKGAFLFEGVAAAILSVAFYRASDLSVGRAIYYGVFHSIAAFCNSGFDLIGENSLAPFVGNWTINIVIMSLIVVGGIGFTVWRDILEAAKRFVSDKKNKRMHKKYRFQLHTKLAVTTTIILIIFGAAFFLFVEYDNPDTIGQLPLYQKILSSFFQSVTLRTAGFYTMAQSGLKGSSKFIGSLMMLIGGSPGGTAGGIKTVSIAVIICGVVSVIRGNESIVISNRKIPMRSFMKAVVIVVLMFTLAFLSIAFLAIVERNSAFQHDFLDLMYEISSVLGTVGLTTGITPHLRDISKFLLVLCMFTGRLGPLSVITALNKNLANTTVAIEYPTEDILIG